MKMSLIMPFTLPGECFDRPPSVARYRVLKNGRPATACSDSRRGESLEWMEDRESKVTAGSPPGAAHRGGPPRGESPAGGSPAGRPPRGGPPQRQPRRGDSP